MQIKELTTSHIAAYGNLQQGTEVTTNTELKRLPVFSRLLQIQAVVNPS